MKRQIKYGGLNSYVHGASEVHSTGVEVIEDKILDIVYGSSLVLDDWHGECLFDGINTLRMLMDFDYGQIIAYINYHGTLAALSSLSIQTVERVDDYRRLVDGCPSDDDWNHVLDELYHVAMVNGN